MLPRNRIPTHPGEILLEEFLNPLEISQVAFAAYIYAWQAQEIRISNLTFSSSYTGCKMSAKVV